MLYLAIQVMLMLIELRWPFFRDFRAHFIQVLAARSVDMAVAERSAKC